MINKFFQYFYCILYENNFPYTTKIAIYTTSLELKFYFSFEIRIVNYSHIFVASSVLLKINRDGSKIVTITFFATLM